MSRKSFIESEGATCKNWTWSWSFVNHHQKRVIFGASNVHESGDRQLILSSKWSQNLKERKSHGFIQALEHIRLILEEGYVLQTFRQIEALQNPETGAVKITSFDTVLEDRVLIVENDGWYALPQHYQGDTASNVAPAKSFLIEGTKTPVTTWAVERNPKARQECLDHFGYVCVVCKFDFARTYGLEGEGFIHVHHLDPISRADGPRIVEPKKDLRPVCPNCHAMIHRGKDMRSIQEMQSLLAKAKKALLS